MSERDCMNYFNHPSLNKIIATFKDDKYLYMLNDICYGLPLNKLMQLSKSLSEEIVKCIITQILLGLQYMHE